MKDYIKMKYDDVIKNLKNKEKEVEIHYYDDGCKTTYTIDIDGDIFDIPHHTIDKIWREHNCYHRIYAIDGSEESGWLDVKLSDEEE